MGLCGSIKRTKSCKAASAPAEEDENHTEGLYTHDLTDNSNSNSHSYDDYDEHFPKYLSGLPDRQGEETFRGKFLNPINSQSATASGLEGEMETTYRDEDDTYDFPARESLGELLARKLSPNVSMSSVWGNENTLRSFGGTLRSMNGFGGTLRSMPGGTLRSMPGTLRSIPESLQSMIGYNSMSCRSASQHSAGKRSISIASEIARMNTYRNKRSAYESRMSVCRRPRNSILQINMHVSSPMQASSPANEDSDDSAPKTTSVSTDPDQPDDDYLPMPRQGTSFRRLTETLRFLTSNKTGNELIMQCLGGVSCALCKKNLTQAGNPVIAFSPACGHKVHSKCLHAEGWTESYLSCPICNTTVHLHE